MASVLRRLVSDAHKAFAQTDDIDICDNGYF